MKKIRYTLALLFLAAGASAQNPTIYFMEGSTLRSQFNPAFAPLQGYVNIPVAGRLEVATSGNLAIDKVLFHRNGSLVTLLDNAVTAADVLPGLDPVNRLGLDVRTNIIGFGAFTRNHKNFWSFDINARVNLETRLPYSLFEFLKTGASNQIRDIGADADAYLEAAFTYSFPLLHDKLYLGIRGKVLVGAARGSIRYDRFDASLAKDRWSVDAAGSMDLTLAGTTVDYRQDDAGNDFYKFDDLNFNIQEPAGYGFAVDLGATYDILPNLQASLAVNDIGFISWDKKHNISGTSAKSLEFTGVNVPDNGEKQPEFDFDILKFSPSEADDGKRMLRATLNAGLEYELWRHKIGLGVFYAARFCEFETRHNVTASVNFHPVRWMTLTGSYTFIDNRAGAVGLALNLCPSWINFFIATDILTSKHTAQFVPIKQSAMNVTLGLGIPLGKRSHRIAAYTPGSRR